MVAAVAVWLLAAAACALLLSPGTRNAGLFALAGSAFALLFHYNIGTVPEIRDLAILLWVISIALLASKTLAGRRRSTV
ncbi:MAG TPA: hypothetical protein VKV02_05080 [Acidobacteriaceae bacterium]|nr:hypothetical protein [Acidobacteriaceae bacterium]